MAEYGLFSITRRVTRSLLFVMLLTLSNLCCCFTYVFYGALLDSQPVQSSADLLAVRKPLTNADVLYSVDPFFTRQALLDILDNHVSPKEMYTDFDFQYAIFAQKSPHVSSVSLQQLAFAWSETLYPVLPNAASILAENLHVPEILRLSLYSGVYSGKQTDTAFFMENMTEIEAASSVRGNLPIAFVSINPYELQEGAPYVMLGVHCDFEQAAWLPQESQYVSLVERPYTHPFYQQILPALDDALFSSPDFEVLRRSVRVSSNQLQVLGVDDFTLLPSMAMGNAFVTEHIDDLESAWLDENASVCLVSDDFARQNALSLGDTLSLEVYSGSPYQGADTLASGLNGACALYVGLDIQSKTEPLTIQVAGLFHEQAWQQDEYALTPNTILVPNRLLVKDYFSFPSGAFYTLVLQPGAGAAFETQMSETGYGGYFHYIDRGGEIARASIAEFLRRMRFMPILALAAMAAFTFFFHHLTRRDAVRNINIVFSLGASVKDTFAFAYPAIALLIIVASVFSPFIVFPLGTRLIHTINAAVFSLNESLAFSNASLFMTSVNTPTLVLPNRAIIWLIVLQSAIHLLLACVLIVKYIVALKAGRKEV